MITQDREIKKDWVIYNEPRHTSPPPQKNMEELWHMSLLLIICIFVTKVLGTWLHSLCYECEFCII